MSQILSRLFLITVIALVATIGQADEPLVWKFKAGEQLNYEMTQKMDTTVAAGPAGNFTTSMSQTMDIVWNVDEVTPEGNAKTRQKIERVRLKMTMPGGQSTEFDSASDDPPQGIAAMLAPLYKAMTEGEFKVTMTPQGKIIEAEAPEGLAEAMKNIPGAASLGDLSSPEGIKQMLMQGSMTLPEGDLKDGQTWETKVDIKGPTGQQEVTTTYEYAGTKDVDGTTFEVVKQSPKIKNIADPNAQVQMTVKDQSAEGEVFFDREKGRMQSSRMQQKMEMEMTVMGNVLTSTIDQTVDMKLKPAGRSFERSSESK